MSVLSSKSVFGAVVTIACCMNIVTAEQVDIAMSLDGKKIHFSYSPAFKFTPLIIHCGKPIKDAENSYQLEGENRTCILNYEPNARNKSGVLFIKGSKDQAEIQLKFDNALCGTAHMTWNNIKYYHLKFRIQDTAEGASYLQRMGEPVGDIVPRSIAGKVVEINFKGAVKRTIMQDGVEEAYSAWHQCYATPFVFRFPIDSNHFEIPHFMPDTEESPYPPMSVNYELVGTCAEISVRGRSHGVTVELDFEDSQSGVAHVLLGYEDGWGFDFKGATFTIRDAEMAASGVVYPENIEVDNNGNSEIKQMIQDLSLIRYESAVENLYRKRLMEGLNSILYGADINHVIANANGTTLLHNACGLSHVELVKWLVEHGADLDALTAKGATVEDCVGGPNAAAIRRILKNARQNKK